MYVVCHQCQSRYNDEYRSTLCPHEGIGYCEICDCCICVCDPEHKAAIHAQRMPRVQRDVHVDIGTGPDIQVTETYLIDGTHVSTVWERGEEELWRDDRNPARNVAPFQRESAAAADSPTYGSVNRAHYPYAGTPGLANLTKDSSTS